MSMATTVCPNCGYKQEASDKCRKCSTLFAYHSGSGNNALEPAAPSDVPNPRKSSPGLFRRAYQVFRWGSLAILILSVALILRRSPPPQVSSDPKAVERLESKLNQMQSEAVPGQPRQVRLDESEINGYLKSNLELKREDDAPGGPPKPAPDSPDPSVQDVQSSVRDVKIALLDDRVQAYVVFDFHGEDMSLQLEGKLHVEDGYLHFDPVAGKLGSLPLPQSSLAHAIGGLMTSPENKEKLRVPNEIRDIRIEHGELVVDYR
jgi:hypothetical protein